MTDNDTQKPEYPAAYILASLWGIDWRDMPEEDVREFDDFIIHAMTSDDG